MLSKILMILLVFASAAGIELPGIIKKKQWKQLAVFTLFFLFGLAVTVMHQIFEYDFSGISHWFVSVYDYE